MARLLVCLKSVKSPPKERELFEEAKKNDSDFKVR